MKIEITPKEPLHLRVRYQGEVVFDQVLAAGQLYDLDIQHPKTCGTAEAFIVEDDGSEMLIGSADYGPCTAS